MRQVNIEQAKTNLSVLITAALNGEEVIIHQNEQSAVKLVPTSTDKPHPNFGSAKGKIEIADDFDETLEDFAEYQ
ncbi:MAG: type II toxin-antitoxin system Phd/YefM family antitoxin [Pyrinomonadaceae bacterium]